MTRKHCPICGYQSLLNAVFGQYECPACGNKFETNKALTLAYEDAIEQLEPGYFDWERRGEHELA